MVLDARRRERERERDVAAIGIVENLSGSPARLPDVCSSDFADVLCPNDSIETTAKQDNMDVISRPADVTFRCGDACAVGFL